MKNFNVIFSLLVFIVPHQGFSAEVETILQQALNRPDYDFIPKFADAYVGGYQIDFYITDVAETKRLILQHGSYLRGTTGNIRLFLQRKKFLSRFPGLELGTSYNKEVYLFLSIGIGGPGS